ncbi:hypothetical protein [Aliikangiella sp. IMCC44359]|uniref:hypothetical protein n=1 Tax=Aliikangiella sp. IMCC44359 TaxID=3459125 RepID=UPI00403B0873
MSKRGGAKNIKIIQWCSLLLLPLFIALNLLGCSSVEKRPAKTSLELQAIQSHHFQTSKSVVFAATISVFQDLGYIINNADIQSGFITAKSATKEKESERVIFKLGDLKIDLDDLTGDSDKRAVIKSSHTQATAFIEELKANETQVRLNFVMSSLSSSHQGQNTQNDRVIEDAETYRIAFDKIGDAIFIRSTN